MLFQNQQHFWSHETSTNLCNPTWTSMILFGVTDILSNERLVVGCFYNPANHSNLFQQLQYLCLSPSCYSYCRTRGNMFKPFYIDSMSLFHYEFWLVNILIEPSQTSNLYILVK